MRTRASASLRIFLHLILLCHPAYAFYDLNDENMTHPWWDNPANDGTIMDRKNNWKLAVIGCVGILFLITICVLLNHFCLMKRCGIDLFPSPPNVAAQRERERRRAQRLADREAAVEEMKKDWEKIEIPVTVIQGEEDKLVPKGNAEFAEKMLSKNEEVSIKMIIGGNHFILWSEVLFITEEIKKLL